MNRAAIHLLLKRYVANDCSTEERELIEQWYELLGDDESVASMLPPHLIPETLHHLWLRILQQTSKAEDGGP